ncbi:MAG: F0F1 ATP synthase subunit A [Parasphingopyxis sp.]|nr:F0F1 ATP synthase subunit A [Parasphingopyxis lamellibrachiae]
MHQFQVEPLVGAWDPAGGSIVFTNSTMWMLIALAAIWLFMWGGMKRELVPGRWQLAVEGLTGFINNMVSTSIGPKGKKYIPFVFTIFMFILFANMLGLVPIGVVGGHPFTVTSHFVITGTMAVMSFSIVLAVGFWKHKLKFFTLFIPHGTPLPMVPLIFMIELISFMVRPFSLALRLFIAMTAGHILLKVFGSFIVQGMNAGAEYGLLVSLPSFLLIVFISALELLVCAIQAYVFALLTTLYINDAENLH